MIKFSIITVAYNSQSTIERSIKSVLNQTYLPYEYIIIDGLSNDDTVKIASSYIDKFNNIGVKYKIFSEKDSGIYDAMNKGISFATGDIVGMINSDDWYEPNALQSVAEVYQIKQFDVFYADLRIINGEKSFIKKSKKDVYPSSAHWNHPTTFILKSIYDDYKYNCNLFYADFDLILRLRRNNKKIFILNKTLANFSFGGISNKKNLYLLVKRIKDKYSVYYQNGYKFWSFFETCIVELAKFCFS